MLRSTKGRVAAVTLAAIMSAASAGHAATFAGGAAQMVRPSPVSGQPAALADRADPVSSRRAQSPSQAAAAPVPSGTWQPLGPAPIGPAALAGGMGTGATAAGRVTAMAVIPSGGTALHPGRLVAGSAGGGIWTSDDGGSSWAPRTDGAADLAIGALTVDPANPDHLIAGTGEDNQCGDCFSGAGILVSTDGGTTWNLQNPGGVFTGLEVGEVAIDPSNSSHAFAATSGGLYVTTDAGGTWAKPTDASYGAVVGSDHVDSVAVDPSNPSTVYIAGAIKAGTGSFLVAKSSDGGGTWASASSGLSAPGGSPLVKLAIAPSSPSTLYVSVGSVGPVALYASTNGAGSWSHLTGAPDYTSPNYGYYGSGNGSDQGWYDNAIAVDPTNPSHILAGGVAPVESSDGGTTWTNINGHGFFAGGTNLLHPDQHAFAFGSGGSVWIGDDGGVFHYTPAASTVTAANGNLNITQFYSGFDEVGGTLLAGTQDNSSATTSSSTLSPWTGVWDGDGGPSAITPGDPSLQFIEADGNLYSTTDAFGSETQPNDITPANDGLFTPPMIVVPNPATPTAPTLFYGGTSLWRTTDPANLFPSWSSVASVSGAKVSAIAASPSSPQVVYVGFSTGTIEVSTNGGQTFAPLAAETDSGAEQFVTGLSVDPTNPDAITASFSYRDTRYKSPSFPHAEQYSWPGTAGTEASGTWTSITGNLPIAAVSRVVYQTGPQGGALLAATDAGVYATPAVNAGSTVWSRVGSDLPNVQVQDLYIDSASPGKLYAVTHGRGAWLLQTPPPQNATRPGITGSVVQGQTLSEVAGTWSPADASIAYQWQDCDSAGSNCQDIPGATGQSYILTSSDVGRTLVVEELATGLGGTTTAVSDPTAVVVPLPPVDQTPPTISGTMTAGQTLTLAHGTWTNSPTAYTEQWEDCDASGAGCAPIGGATGTSYTLTGDDVGHTVRVSESASNAGGPSQQPAVSAATAPVAPAPTKPVAPANTAAPVVSGVAAVGQALTATVGQWSGTGPISYAEQWQRCTPACAGIPGATGPSYVIASGDVGAYLRVVVTAMNSAGSSEAASGQVGPVPAIQPSRAAIRGALAAALAPNGAAARLASLLKHRGYTFRFRAPSAGRLVIGWYLVPRGAHLARARPVLVATARAVVPGPGTRRYALRLTVAGRRLLARRARVPLTGEGTFTPNGGGPVSVVKRFTLRR